MGKPEFVPTNTFLLSSYLVLCSDDYIIGIYLCRLVVLFKPEYMITLCAYWIKLQNSYIEYKETKNKEEEDESQDRRDIVAYMFCLSNNNSPLQTHFQTHILLTCFDIISGIKKIS